jgi:hypothetical protein
MPTLLPLIVLLAGASPARTDKTDIVQMRNGDRLVCEIRDLDQGQLRVKTDALGTLYAEWDKVVRIESGRVFEVQMTSGTRHYGSLVPAPTEGRLVVAATSGNVEIELAQVARLELLRSHFWSRFEGALDLGGSYTRANSLIQLNPAFDATHVGRAYQAGIDLSATWTRQEDKADTSRAVGSLSYLRFRDERWLGFAVATAERNTELGLDVRFLSSLGVGRILLARPHSRIQTGAGLTVTREKAIDGESAENPEGEPTSNLEGLLTAQWQVFTYSFPKTRVKVSFALYPGLTDWGRVRGNADVQVKREIVKDFTVGLTFYDSFDNRPATESAAHNDWGATIALGWTF